MVDAFPAPVRSRDAGRRARHGADGDLWGEGLPTRSRLAHRAEGWFRAFVTPGRALRRVASGSDRTEGVGQMTVTGHAPGGARVRCRDGEDSRATCLRRQRWLLGVVAGAGGRHATLREEGCLATGAAACTYALSWVEGVSPLPATLAAGCTGAVLGLVSVGTPVPAGGWVLAAVIVAAVHALTLWRTTRANRAAERTSAIALEWLLARSTTAAAAPPFVHHGTPAVAGGEPWPAPSLEQEGDVWRLSYAGTAVTLRHSRGLALLAHLIRQPDREIHVHVLDTITPAGGSAIAREAPAPDDGVMPLEDAGAEMFDARARSEYRGRVNELRSDLAEAESSHDVERAERIQTELGAVLDELRKGTGLRGRARRIPTDVERRRVAITRRIRAAITQISKHHPTLGAHLTATVSTGYRCVYGPRGGPPATRPAARIGQPGPDRDASASSR